MVFVRGVANVNKSKFVKFKLCKDGKFRFVPAPEPCHNCNFSDIEEIDLRTDEFKGCAIGHDIDEGKRNCPYDVPKEGRMI